MSLLSSNPSHRQPQPPVGLERWLSHSATSFRICMSHALDDTETLSYHGQGRKMHRNPNPRNITEKGPDKCRRMGNAYLLLDSGFILSYQIRDRLCRFPPGGSVHETRVATAVIFSIFSW